jgi:DNA polymerase III epsilon subunit-like protein
MLRTTLALCSCTARVSSFRQHTHATSLSQWRRDISFRRHHSSLAQVTQTFRHYLSKTLNVLTQVKPTAPMNHSSGNSVTPAKDSQHSHPGLQSTMDRFVKPSTAAKQPAFQTPAALQALRSVQRLLDLVPKANFKTDLPEPVFVCIDCEAFEHAQHKITEVGVAVLDTRTLVDIDPGLDGGAWLEKIQYAHYRPVEHAHLRNKNFIRGCAESFNFGPTTWLRLPDAKKVLHNIFRYPSQLAEAADFTKTWSGPARNIIFVGHNASSDDTFLKQLGFELSVDAVISCTIDTQQIAGGTKKSPIGLHRLCLGLDMEPVNLHNAGNDAAYTLQAMVKMAVRDHVNPGSVYQKLASLPVRKREMPKFKYSPLVAPQIWAGTAVAPSAGPQGATSPNHNKPTPAVQRREERRRHKHDIRASHPKQVTNSAGALAQQQSLPPPG